MRRLAPGEGFAATLQEPRKTFWCLQERCKCPEKLFGVCRNAARAAKNFLVFAGTLQVLRKTFWCLRESRKCHEKLFGVCGSPASVSRNFLVFAGVPQVSRRTFWCLRESRKCHEKLFGVCIIRQSKSTRFPIKKYKNGACFSRPVFCIPFTPRKGAFSPLLIVYFTSWKVVE